MSAIHLREYFVIHVPAIEILVKLYLLVHYCLLLKVHFAVAISQHFTLHGVVGILNGYADCRPFSSK